jgi:hypothetical protein
MILSDPPRDVANGCVVGYLVINHCYDITHMLKVIKMYLSKLVLTSFRGTSIIPT